MGPLAEPRAIPAVTALAVRQTVEAAGLTERGSGALRALSDALSAIGAAATGPFGALSADTDDESPHRTEVCWPVFRTGAA